MVGPDLAGQFPWIGVDAIGCEVPAGTLNITRKQREHVRIVVGINRLGKVDQNDRPLPVEDIICRQVAVNTTMDQRQLDIAHDTIKERLCFLLWQFDLDEARSRLVNAPNIFHQDSIAYLGERTGNIGAVRVKQALRLVLVFNPRGDLGSASPFALPCCRTPAPAVSMFGLSLFVALDAAEAVESVVAQTAKHARAVDLCRQVLDAR